MASDDKATALGAGLVANDKWLVTTLLQAERWASGTAEELVDGSAWRRFASRLDALGARIQGAAPADRADGYRYLCMLVRNAFDVAIEEVDPDRPRITWLTRRNKLGWDCPDALYAKATIRDDAVYRIEGRRGGVHFLGLQVMTGIRSLHNAHADEWSVGPDGRFELVVGGPERPQNWCPLGAGADSIWIRQFFYDWAHESPAVLAIERIDDGPRGEPGGPLDAGFMARRLDAVATHVEANVDLWLGTFVAIRDRYTNVFPEEVFGGTNMGAQAHQAAGTCCYQIAPDEALVLEVRPPRAKYWSVDLCNVWLESLDYANHQSSLNGHQAVLDPDGVFRAAITHDDPGIANWLDPVGHTEGSLIYRWNLADSTPRPTLTLVKRADLASRLPPSTKRVPPDERRRVIEARRAGVRLRLTRPV